MSRIGDRMIVEFSSKTAKRIRAASKALGASIEDLTEMALNRTCEEIESTGTISVLKSTSGRRSMTIQVKNSDYLRLEAGIRNSRNMVFETPEALASLAVDVGLYSLEVIDFDVSEAIIKSAKGVA